MLKKYLTRSFSRETGSENELRPLLPENQRGGNRPREQVSETQTNQTKKPEARGPNPLTGEGMESQRLKAEANGLWMRIRGVDVTSYYVNKLTEAFDQRDKRLVNLAMKDKQRIEEVLDCSRNDFLTDLQFWKETLKHRLSENALDRSLTEAQRTRALNSLEAVADLQQHLEWRLEHADSLEYQGRLEIKEVFQSLDENNFRDYLVSDHEVRQSIRVINRMYIEIEGTYQPNEKGKK